MRTWKFPISHEVTLNWEPSPSIWISVHKHGSVENGVYFHCSTLRSSTCLTGLVRKIRIIFCFPCGSWENSGDLGSSMALGRLEDLDTKARMSMYASLPSPAEAKNREPHTSPVGRKRKGENKRSSHRLYVKVVSDAPLQGWVRPVLWRPASL